MAIAPGLACIATRAGVTAKARLASVRPARSVRDREQSRLRRKRCAGSDQQHRGSEHPSPALLADDLTLPAMSPLDPPGEAARPTLPHGDPVAAELILAIHGGDQGVLRRLLSERPELASVRMVGRKGMKGGWRTPLLAATDWPGYFPAAPATAAVLLDAGADPNDDSGGKQPETPLHWAASSVDVDVAVVLIDGGANLETPGGCIGTPLDNAVGFACWHVARLLVARGAKVDKLWHAAALGMLSRAEELASEETVAGEEISQ